jgi:hypothetical protein
MRGRHYGLECKDAIPAQWKPFPLPAIPDDDTVKTLSDPGDSPATRF